MFLNMYWFTESIKNLWKTSRADDLIAPKKVEIFKSSFDNLYAEEDPKARNYCFSSDKIPYHFNELQEKANDFRNLQVNSKGHPHHCKHRPPLGSHRLVEEDQATERTWTSEFARRGTPYRFRRADRNGAREETVLGRGSGIDE